MKKILNKLFVPVLASRPVSALATRFFFQGIPVFMIHRMEVEGQPTPGITPDHLRRCLKYLVDNDYTLISLEDAILALRNKTTLPDKSAVFTMDDGFIDQAQTAAPVFTEFNCPLTFFVITDMINQTIWPWDAQASWIIDNTSTSIINLQLPDEKLKLRINDKKSRHSVKQTVRNIIKEIDAELIPDTLARLAQSADVALPRNPPPHYKAINWDMARELETAGIRFAPHSKTHRILSKLRPETAREEILGSWDNLKRELSYPLKVFCYPTGRLFDYGPREINILKDSGFIGATSTLPGHIYINNQTENQLYSLPRFSLPESMTYFIQYCTWIECAKRKYHTRRY